MLELSSAEMILAQQAGVEDACGASPGMWCRSVYDLTESVGIARLADWLVKPVKVALILLIAYVLVRLARRAIRRMIDRILANQAEPDEPSPDDVTGDGPLAALQRHAARRTEFLSLRKERSTQRAQTLGAVLRSIATISIFTIALVIVLGEFDINLGPLIAGAGIVGVAVGFGAQSLVKDFLSGIFMLLEDQYGVGDIVDVGEATGVVEAINLRTTKLRDVNGTLWHVPNGEIRRVGNKSQEWARAVLDVEVAYDTDIERASTIIKKVADELWLEGNEAMTILEEPQLWGVERFGESAIAIRLAVKVEPAEQFTTARELRKRLKTRFDAEGIEIPFPQRTLWIRAGEAATPELTERTSQTPDEDALPE